MTVMFRNCVSTAAVAAALSMATTPVLAADFPAPAVGVAPAGADRGWQASDDIADGYRHRRYRRNRGVDAGDVLAGVLVIGTIAAVASAASRSDRDRYRTRDYRYDRRDSTRRSDSSGLDRVVDICVSEIDRKMRVNDVSNVARIAAGWQVDGSLYDGQGFTCRIGNDGRIDDIEYGGGVRSGARISRYSYPPGQDRQFSDQTYADAWNDVGQQPRAVYDDEGGSRQELPAYPGGPIGDERYLGE